ncbi:hypothetical protein [Pseudoalteromonas rubra]|uniref:Uncharacterized protein n=1 Tax=Pseudoalteromonas rubra TaxID=43658 RepID=A0A0U3HP42_9GAMM|nr:hypothetical protein [Pseudoalteromonas rubra]ALU44693.1 hypothetical protein AT705_18140 [Pseudoalteromonas rubra]
MKKSAITASLYLLSTSAMAGSAIKQLDVLGDAVTFTLEQPKSHAIPACVSADNQQKWAINLNSLQGQAMYSLLVTAVSKEHLVNVTSANRCESIADIEQAEAISLTTKTVSAPDSGILLYKGDGKTLLGKVLSESFYGNQYYRQDSYRFAPVGGATQLQNYSIYRNVSIYYVDSQCEGEAYSDKTISPEQSYYSKARNFYYHTAVSPTEQDYLHVHGDAQVYKLHDDTGECTAYGGQAKQFTRMTRLTYIEHPLCGSKGCIIK